MIVPDPSLKKETIEPEQQVFWPAFGLDAKYHPLFSKKILETWVRKAAEDKGYAAKGQVERWIADIKWYETQAQETLDVKV